MIIDCFTYNGEFEALLLRLHELAGVVDHHVLIEAMTTFTGLDKPLYYLARDQARLGDLANRILPVVAILPDGGPWEREAYQRNMIGCMLDGKPDDTVVLIGDVDEIPKADAVGRAVEKLRYSRVQSFDQALCLYYANNRCTTTRWRGTQATHMHNLRRWPPQSIRDHRNVAPVTQDGGWHFGSLLGDEGAARFERKLVSFSHADECKPFATPDNIAAAIDAGRDVSGRQDILFRADLTPKSQDYPEWLWEHRHDMAHLFAPGTTL